jgi:hypothetical protein
MTTIDIFRAVGLEGRPRWSRGRCCLGGTRERDGWRCFFVRSDDLDDLVERRRKPEKKMPGVDAEFVVPAPQVLTERTTPEMITPAVCCSCKVSRTTRRSRGWLLHES